VVTEEITEVIDQLKGQLKTNNIHFEFIVIFGSYAAGKPNKYSDIDVAVISSQFGRNRLEERIKLMKIAATVDLRIEPHPVSLKDWQENWKSVVTEIKQTGIQIPA
jgi:predicted nucleotidyltransferase